MEYDVAFIGDSVPALACAILLKKYRPGTRIAVIQRESLGCKLAEPLMPACNFILHEMGVWDSLEEQGTAVARGRRFIQPLRADWRLGFISGEQIEQTRPQRFRGQRTRTGFHVDVEQLRADSHAKARELGVDVMPGESSTWNLTGDRLDGAHLASARLYALSYRDSTDGLSAERYEWQQLYQARTVEAAVESTLIADEDHAIWLVPLSEGRLAISATGMTEPSASLEDLLAGVLPPDLDLLSDATPLAPASRRVSDTRLEQRLAGKNWFLLGDAIGDGHPYVNQRLTLALFEAYDLAHVLAALLNGFHDEPWLAQWYSELSLRRLLSNHRFGEFWRSAVRPTGDDAKHAIDALFASGLASLDFGGPMVGGLPLGQAKWAVERMTGTPCPWKIAQYNEFRLDLLGAEKVMVPIMAKGKLSSAKCYRRGDKLLPILGAYATVLSLLHIERDAVKIVQLLCDRVGASATMAHPVISSVLDTIEGMILEGWIDPRLNKKRPLLEVDASDPSVSAETEATVPFKSPIDF